MQASKQHDAAAQLGVSSTVKQKHGGVRLCRMMVLRAGLAMASTIAVLLYLYIMMRSKTLLWCLAAAEVAFLVHYWGLCVPHFTAVAHSHTPDDHDAQETKAKLVQQLMRVDDTMGCMQSWFINAGPGDIKRQNLLELFAYAVWYKSLDQMEADGLMPELEDLMSRLECNCGYKVPGGYNPELRFMSHLWEPLRHVYRPLVFYVVMELLALLCHVALIAVGFKLHEIDGISYYTFRMGPQKLVPAISAPLKRRRSAPELQPSKQQQQQQSRSAGSTAADDTANMPIVFLHGVGAGLLPYLSVIFRLAALGRPMILPHSKHVSMRLVSWLPTVDDMADATAAILAAHGITKASVVAHSYGTMVASRLVLKYEQLVHSLCLMDPVCFAMFMPNLLRNFLYTRHNSGCWPIDLIMTLVSSELHCSANFSRKFFWSCINLWDEHIPERTLVALSGRDILSPTAHVHRWLKEHTHAQVLYNSNMHHAGILLNTEWQSHIISTFVNVMERPAATSPGLLEGIASESAAVAADADARAGSDPDPDPVADDDDADAVKHPQNDCGGMPLPCKSSQSSGFCCNCHSSKPFPVSPGACSRNRGNCGHSPSN